MTLVRSFRRAVKRDGWRETSRRALRKVAHRVGQRLVQWGDDTPKQPVSRARRPSLRRPVVLTDGSARRIIGAAGLQPGEVSLLTDARFGTQAVRRGSADDATYDRVFVRDAYGFKLSVTPKTILDLGAGAGHTTAWYHVRYPEARIVAVVTDGDEATMARVNSSLVAGKRGRVDVDNDGPVDATTVAAVMDRHHIETVDLLRIADAAGDDALFADHTEWLDRVNSLVIELGNGLSSELREPVTAALDRHFVDYDEVRRGDVSLFTRRYRLDERPGG